MVKSNYHIINQHLATVQSLTIERTSIINDQVCLIGNVRINLHYIRHITLKHVMRSESLRCSANETQLLAEMLKRCESVNITFIWWWCYPTPSEGWGHKSHKSKQTQCDILFRL